jgi:uncharacterized protein (UPF0276 family)
MVDTLKDMTVRAMIERDYYIPTLNNLVAELDIAQQVLTPQKEKAYI